MVTYHRIVRQPVSDVLVEVTDGHCRERQVIINGNLGDRFDGVVVQTGDLAVQCPAQSDGHDQD